MNKRYLFGVLLVVLLALTLAPAALASHPGQPVGSCPRGFDLHHAGAHDHHEHDEGMAHQHVGLDGETDANEDGYWCVKHLSGNQHIHVHIDNYLPLS